MKRLEIQPEGWPCLLIECRPGYFVYRDALCFKSEYRNQRGHLEAFCESGEQFWGGAKSDRDREVLAVQPVTAVWVEVEP